MLIVAWVGFGFSFVCTQITFTVKKHDFFSHDYDKHVARTPGRQCTKFNYKKFRCFPGTIQRVAKEQTHRVSQD